VHAAENRRSPGAIRHALSCLPLDDYAAESPAEFFAVASESFFSDPLPLSRAYPAFHALLTRFYRQDVLTNRK
jgi:Mlc titration factor MtfA (ptsG expression regulator)